MKTPALCLMIALAAGSPLAAGEIGPGATLAEVHATLGLPRGRAQAGGKDILYYERGEVVLQNGRVEHVALRTPEEHAVLVAREDRRRDEREARRAKSLAEGTALRDAKLADPEFKHAPAAYRVAYWEDFARRYPEVTCAEQLAIARIQLKEQVAQELARQEEERMRRTELEERLAATERRAAYARPYYSAGYGRRYYHPVGLGPITYTFFDSPLPPYTTPSGNPAGNLGGLVIDQAPRSPSSPGGASGHGWDRSGHGHAEHHSGGFGHRHNDGRGIASDQSRM
ncbi:MAG TPA: hypothetical protein VG734_16810 [Lacunisphaera sp.]|nr:hypothetical protein [Lacunisphaera sp.]